jgi:hypothetical protein
MIDELRLLPQYDIDEVISQDSTVCEGRFDSLIRLEDGWIGYLVSLDGLCVEGKFYNYDRVTLGASFVPKLPNHLPLLHAGRRYAFADGYWGERIEIVMDVNRKWAKALFKPQDAMEYKSGHNRILGPIGQSPNFRFEGEGTKIPGGWDHEHCFICMEKISVQTQPMGYSNKKEEWVCESCYVKYIRPKRLGFLDRIAVSQIRGQQ